MTDKEITYTVGDWIVHHIYGVGQVKKVENPVCPNCGKHMKSKGVNQGYKCIKCGIKSTKPSFKKVKREISLGFYEVPVCARRHLSMPLKRFKS